MCVRREFSYESARERILKIGPNLPKLLSNIKGYTFLSNGASEECNECTHQGVLKFMSTQKRLKLLAQKLQAKFLTYECTN